MNFPYKALSETNLLDFAKQLKIPNFRGVFMRDTLPDKPLNMECGILNLDIQRGKGTHWTCWSKNKNNCYYFDSYGLMPPTEFENYIKSDLIINTYKIQKENDVICGQLCLYVLYKLLVLKKEFNEILLGLFTYKNVGQYFRIRI